MKGNAIVGQSGGPTSVINCSLAGVIEEAMKTSDIEHIYGMHYAIEGFMNEQMIDLNNQPDHIIKGLRTTPSSALGSSRHKLVDEDFPVILDVLKKHDIRYFFLIGGNDTMDTIHRVENYCREQNYELRGIGIPKTVDNDLYGTDHTPGFPSAARYNALSVKQGGWLARDMKKVDQFVVFQTIGRDAGWLAAATALARQKEGDAPHLIYCPERVFNAEEFIADARKCVNKYGWVSVVVSEGLKYADGTPVSQAAGSDKFNNIEFGAMSGSSVALQVHKKLSDSGLGRGEFQIIESLNMSAADRVQDLDRDEAYQCGVHAVQLATQGISGQMVTIDRQSNSPYQVQFGQTPLENVAVRAKAMPDDFINERGNDITSQCIEYLRPLVGTLPQYIELEMHMV